MIYQRAVLWFMVMGMICAGVGACCGNCASQNMSSSAQVAVPEPNLEEPAGGEAVAQQPPSSEQTTSAKPVFNEPACVEPGAGDVLSPDRATVPGMILGEPARFQSKIVTVTGVFHGWRGPCRSGPPVSRNDWMIADTSGCLYVHGPVPPGLDPARPAGEKISVTGVVRLKKGQPYLETGQ